MLDLSELEQAVAAHGTVARVVVAGLAGSSPREVGAAMLVWPGADAEGQSGTIGGGTLEYQAAETARRLLATNAPDQITRHPLGPALGQCCGGAVTLLTEIYDAARLANIPTTGLYARGSGTQPLTVQRLLQSAQNAGYDSDPQYLDGWFIEPIAHPRYKLWLWGAGHVGRAIARTLAPIPDIAITWIDTGPERFPEEIPHGVTTVPASNPAQLMPHAPQNAHHLILTYSHALDLDLCHAALSHGFASLGLIGSATKKTRFRRRLTDLGHSQAQLARLICPIGDPALGKHPQAIAIGVAHSVATTLQDHARVAEEKRA